MKGLLVTLSSYFILPAMRIKRERKRDVVRFGYRKTTLVAPWEVAPGRKKRGKSEAKKPVKPGDSCRKATRK